MDDRKIKILNAIIDSYISVPSPVGSRKISKEFDLGISSATIRNEMSDLEDLGYLKKPHSSAGRVPSDKAYRFYVNELINSLQKMNKFENNNIKDLLVENIYDIDDIFKNAANILANETNYTSYVIAPKGRGQVIKEIQLISLSENLVLAMIIGDRGLVEKSVFRLEEHIPENELSLISKRLNDNLSGINFNEISKIKLKISGEMIQYSDLITGILELVSSFGHKTKSYEVFSYGLTNIFNYEEYQDLDKAKKFISFMENENNIVELLNQGSKNEDIDVIIGSENMLDIMKSNTVISANYLLEDNTLGKIAIVGPVRMDYLNMIRIMKLFSTTLSNIIREIMWE